MKKAIIDYFIWRTFRVGGDEGKTLLYWGISAVFQELEYKILIDIVVKIGGARKIKPLVVL